MKIMPKKKKIKVVNDDDKENKILSSEEDQEVLSEDAEMDDDELSATEEVQVENALQDDSIPIQEKLDLLKAAWETSESKAAEYLDGWQRQKAEFSNYKKRINRDRELHNQEAVGKVVKRYLPVLDDLERALKKKPSGEDYEVWLNGIELIYRKLVSALESDGVKPMKVDGEMFDPNKHLAVAQIDSEDHESGQIVEVLETGYSIGDRVLRTAKVCIAT
jgi:molecular chaperone GrpE